MSGKEDSIVANHWEYIDPTPDIFALFQQFDQRFFDGRLQCVEVKWSPRMTLCAGVCSYQGRGGLCSIRLSLPLLKLRPRKDLVETLLHEMIHAYLFITQRNTDRDGHGPEFQKHMHRINKESGCNITIYHSFHEEVKLYQQHIWRCDGPCRTRKPFFGFVRRSMNRAPSSRDLWWAEHQASCGGKFTKIQEPPDYKQKTAKGKEKDNKNGDIRKFVKTTDGTNSKPGTSGISTKQPTGGLKNVKGFGDVGSGRGSTKSGTSTSGISTNQPNGGLKNVKGFGDIDSAKAGTSGLPVGTVPTGLGNIRGFGGTSGRGSGAIRGAVSNKTGTLVVTGGRGRGTTNTVSTETQSDFVPFQGKGFVLGKGTGVSRLVQPTPNKLPQTPSLSNGSQKPNTEIKPKHKTTTNQNTDIAILVDTPPKKKIKSKNDVDQNVDESILVDTPPKIKSEDDVNCPICNKSMPITSINPHLDSCLPMKSTQVINVEDEDEDMEEEKLAKCPLCDSYHAEDNLMAHINDCAQNLRDSFEAQEAAQGDDDPVETADTESSVPCPVCGSNVDKEEINQHLDNCLSISAIKGDSFS